jgi:hypothetical protein
MTAIPGRAGSPLWWEVIGRRVLLVAALAVGLLCAAPAAQARSLHAPKWLKGPYHRYTLTYDATDTSDGTTVTSEPDPPPGESACDTNVTRYQGSATVHVNNSYELLFGRYRPPGHPFRFAFVYRLASHSGSLQASVTEHGDTPAGCPPAEGGPLDAACTEHANTARPEDFAVGAGRHRHQYGATLVEGLDPSDPVCSGDDTRIDEMTFPSPSPTHFTVILPSAGSIAFTDTGIKARKTFHGTVTTQPQPDDGTHAGQGTDPEADGSPQRDWNFATTQTGTFTLAPR